jgi:poly(A) polymerase
MATYDASDIYVPYVKPVTLSPPSDNDKALDATLKAFMDENIIVETDAEMKRRNDILAEIGKIFREWVIYVALEVLNLPSEEAQDAGGEVFISGSHRLGVKEPGADIDTVCVAPFFCTREHFFSSLRDIFQNHPQVTNFSSVETAMVPVMSFDFAGVPIDFLFARLSINRVPRNFNIDSILDDRIMRNLDPETEKSLNGPRVTNMLAKLVGKEAYPNFLIVLRCIRLWAKRRGLYGNKFGYLGGINCNILVCQLLQLYPKGSPSHLLSKFFLLYKMWKWPNPVMLNRIQPNPPGERREVWDKETHGADIMPIITPAYPAMNSSFSVNRASLDIMTKEIERGYMVTKRIVARGGKNWGELFEPTDFFVRYSYYLACNIIGNPDFPVESNSWEGFVQSRVRRMSMYMQEQLPVAPLHFHPSKFSSSKHELSITYFIGFDVNTAALRRDSDKAIRVDDVVARFWNDLRRYPGAKVDGLTFTADCITWNKLPKEVFESIGGVDAAKSMRKKYKPNYGKPKVVPVAEDKDAAEGAVKEESGDEPPAAGEEGLVEKLDDGAKEAEEGDRGTKRKLDELGEDQDDKGVGFSGDASKDELMTLSAAMADHDAFSLHEQRKHNKLGARSVRWDKAVPAQVVPEVVWLDNE